MKRDGELVIEYNYELIFRSDRWYITVFQDIIHQFKLFYLNFWPKGSKFELPCYCMNPVVPENLTPKVYVHILTLFLHKNHGVHIARKKNYSKWTQEEEQKERGRGNEGVYEKEHTFGWKQSKND